MREGDLLVCRRCLVILLFEIGGQKGENIIEPIRVIRSRQFGSRLTSSGDGAKRHWLVAAFWVCYFGSPLFGVWQRFSIHVFSGSVFVVANTRMIQRIVMVFG